MARQRENLEQPVVKKFEEIARKHEFPVFKGQGKENRIPIEGNAYFQFGDLRVDTISHHVVVEVESAGGVNNLVKYWYPLETQLIKKPVVLLHVFRQTSEGDYASHLALWDFLLSQMKKAIGDRIEAIRYTYRNLTELEGAVTEFEKHLR